MRYVPYFVRLFLLTQAAAIAMYAQTPTATLSGTVTDSSGAVVAGAKVVVTAAATGVKATTTTSSEGLFSIPALPAGEYTLTALQSGFAQAEIRNIVLEVGSRVAIPVRLQVGDVKESVTVSADAGALELQTASGERSTTITGRQILDLMTQGRNTLDLLKIVPGMVVTQDTGWGSFVTNYTRAWAAINSNGTRATMKEMLLDGADNVNTGANNTLNVSVNPDALAEVKVLTSNLPAEYGRAGGSVMQATTRSGTSEFHGVVRYFRRDGGLNANTFFNNAAGVPRAVYRYAYYGYNIGGPVLIPGTNFNKGRNKLFFFWDHDIQPQRVPPGATSIYVPTQAERNGDFSRSTNGNGGAIVVRDPNTGQPFPGNLIPASRFFKYGRNILNVLPLPNTTAGGPLYNYISQVSTPYTSKAYVLRIDYYATESTRLSGRVAANSIPGSSAYGGNYFNISYNFPLAPMGQRLPPISLAFTVTHTFTPTITNEFVFGSTRNHNRSIPSSPGLLSSTYGIDFPLFYGNASGPAYLPSFSFGGIANQTPASMTIYALPRHNLNSNWNIVDNVTKVAGNHIFKVGIFAERGLLENLPVASVNSQISFNVDANNPLNAGNPYGNALLGAYTTYTQSNANLQSASRFKNVEGYVQDTWKVSRRLTLDLGLRISWIPPWTDPRSNYFVPSAYDPAKAVRLYTPALVNGARRAVDPANAPAVPTAQNTFPTAYIGLIVPGSGDPYNGIRQAKDGYYAGGFQDRGAHWGPRFGFAYDVGGSGKLLVRGGYGISYDRVQSNIVTGQVNTPPAVQTTQLLYGYLDNLATASGYLAPVSLTTYAPDGRVPSVQSFNLSVQSNIGLGTVIDVAYVGALGRHLYQQININGPAYFTTFQRWAQDPSLFPGGVVPNVEPNLPGAYARAGLSFSGANALPVNFVRPYKGYGDINYRAATGSSNYHALQVSARRALAKGLTFGVSYSWSRAFVTGLSSLASPDFASTNPYNTRRYDYQLANYDRTHTLVVNYVYALPKFQMGFAGGRAARAILNHWQVSGTSQYSSGAPYTLGLAVQGVNAGQRILGTYSIQPLPYRVGGAPGPSGGIDINPSAYYVPGIGDIGPYPQTYLRQPGWVNHDVAVFRNVPFSKESSRFLQLRVEMFNAFNHTEFSGVNSGTQLATASGAIGNAIFPSYPDVRITNNLRPAGSRAPLGSFFGEPNAARDPRIIQLGAKLYF